jgi:hypothetical protein
MSQSHRITCLQKWYYISSPIIALIAVLGFVLSLYSSYEMTDQLGAFSNTLSGFDKNLESLAHTINKSNEPLLKYAGQAWRLMNSSKELSCSNPPISIRFSYVNVSKVPLQIKDHKVVFKRGVKTLDIDTEQKSGDLILSPNEAFSYYLSGEGLASILSEARRPDGDPEFSVSSVINVLDLEGRAEYTYVADTIIPFSCSEISIRNPVEYKSYGFSNYRQIRESFKRSP